MTDIAEDGVLGGHDGLSMLDLKTQLLTIDPALRGTSELAADFRYHATFVHENSHWIRFHGTTLGAALLAMQVACRQAVLTAFPAIPASEKRALLRARRGGTPIIGRGEIRQVGDSMADSLRVTWLSSRIAYSLLLDSRALDRERILEPGVALGLSLADAHIVGEQLFVPDMLSRRVLPLTEHRWESRSVETAQGRLTGNALFECAAVLDEIASMRELGKLRGPDTNAGEIQAEALREVLTGPYGLPLRIFLSINRRTHRDSPDALVSTMMAALDFALNPPLPPAIHYDMLAELTWEQLDPATRFVQACHTLKWMRPMSRFPSGEEVLSFQAGMAGILEWPFFDEYAGPLSYRAAEVDFRAVPDGGSPPQPREYEYPATLAQVQAWLWALRFQYPGIVTYLGYAPNVQLEMSHSLLFNGLGRGWFHAPLHRFPEGSVRYAAGWDEEKRNLYLTSLGVSILVNHLVSAVGPLRRGLLPLGSAPNEHLFWRRIADLVREALEIDDPIDDVIPPAAA